MIGILSPSESDRKQPVLLTGLVLIAVLILAACGPTATRVPVTPSTAPRRSIELPTATPIVQSTPAESFSEQEVATLSSLKKVADFPLYTMHYYESSNATSIDPLSTKATLPRTWACSLFAALGGADKFYGRNFDWMDSPALLLFNHPTTGYASVSMVDLAYLGFGEQSIG